MGKTDADRDVEEALFCPLCGARIIRTINNNSEEKNNCNPGGDEKFIRVLDQNSVNLCLCQIFRDSPAGLSPDSD